MEQLTWHQQQGRKRAYQARNMPAHILAPDYINSGLTLCGIKGPKVTVDSDKRHSDGVSPCRRCCNIADNAPLKGKVKVQFRGSTVTVNKYPRDGWIATSWEDGLPLSRKPVTVDKLLALMAKYPYTAS